MRHDIACVEEMFLVKDYASLDDAKKARNSEARKLRRKGYIVECREWDFRNISGDIAFTLEAAKPTEARSVEVSP